MNYMNLYMSMGWGIPEHAFLRNMVLGVALFILIMITAFIIAKRITFNSHGLFLYSSFIILICTFFLPNMHERYAYVGEVLLLLCLVLKFRLRVLIATVMIYLANFSSYLYTLFQLNFLPIKFLAILNLAALILLAYELFVPDKRTSESADSYNPYWSLKSLLPASD